VSVRVVTPAATAAVTLVEAKSALLVDHDADDVYIQSLIDAANEEAQAAAGRSFVTCTLEMALEAWPAVIRLERPPVQSITSITYYDTANTAYTMPAADYVAITDIGLPVVTPAAGASWPSASLRAVSPIRVRYVAGYGDAHDVPARYRQLILALVAVDYENREGMNNMASAQRERVLNALSMEWGWAT